MALGMHVPGVVGNQLSAAELPGSVSLGVRDVKGKKLSAAGLAGSDSLGNGAGPFQQFQ